MCELDLLALARFVEDIKIPPAGIALVQEDGLHAGLPQHVAQFVRTIRGVDVHQHDAGERGGQLR